VTVRSDFTAFIPGLALFKYLATGYPIKGGLKTIHGDKPKQILLCNFISKIWNRHFCNNISKFKKQLPSAKSATAAGQTMDVCAKKILAGYLLFVPLVPRS
jgi:hypothetical protein